MLKLFFIVAWRNLYRERLTSFIQIMGLIIGISCFVLIQLYVNHQKNYNTMFTAANDIYRIDLIRDENKPQALTPLRLARELKQNFTPVQDSTRVSTSRVSIKHQQSVYSEKTHFVDANYFEFFDFELLEGDIETALNIPNSLVIHQDLAKKYFASEIGIIGKRLTINGQEHQVTGVIKKSDMPNTMPVQLLVLNPRFYEVLADPAWVESWNFNATVTFVKLKENTLIETLTTNISDYYQQRTAGLSSYNSYRINIESLLDIHLHTDTSRTLTPPGSAVMVIAFTVISIMILILACVNFTNLSTAAAMRRGKDVGVRKALGASKLQLIAQYLFEALLQSGMATAIAVIIVNLLLPYFNQLMNVQMSFEFTVSSLLQLGTLSLLVGVIAGSYPAFYLSHLSAAYVLKGLVNTSRSGVIFRQTLIVLQFAIAAVLLVSSLVVNWQMQFIKDMPQGFNRDSVIVINRGDAIYDTFKTRILRNPNVSAVTMSHTVPTKATRTSAIVRPQNDLENEVLVGNNPVSYDFFKTYGIQILAGRDFSIDYTNDAYFEDEENWPNSRGKIIINETLARSLGWQVNEAIGKMVTLGSGTDGLHSHQIIAVTEDTHYINVKNAMKPMIYVLSEMPQALSLRWTSVRFKPGITNKTLKDIESIWLELDGDLAFKYDWTADLFDTSYRNESQQTHLLNVFSALAILVTAIGLFGLAAFNTQRRIKEIAIRKILGAHTAQLCFMLVNQFSVLVILANLLALPLAYFLLQDWLNGFIYRIDMPYSAFIISVLVSVLIAYITVFSIAFKAATEKPVNALHYE